jgi:hypothetical protein
MGTPGGFGSRVLLHGAGKLPCPDQSPLDVAAALDLLPERAPEGPSVAPSSASGCVRGRVPAHAACRVHRLVFARAEVSDVDQPTDGVRERLAQRAGLDRELGARFGVVATGGAVEDPDPFSRPWQSCAQAPLRDVRRLAEGGEEPRWESDEGEATAGEVGERADDVRHGDVVALPSAAGIAVCCDQVEFAAGS